MKKICFTLFPLLLGIFPVMAQAQDQTTSSTTTKGGFFSHQMDYDLRAFFSIGGTSPIGLPNTIRHIAGYNPNLQLGLSANATKWIDDRWGIRVGLKMEGKGMDAKARVKNYHTEIIQNDSKVPGYFTGLVKTDVRNVYLTLPVSVVLKTSKRLSVFGGFYVSVPINKKFNDSVSEGYLREETPVGTKLTFSDGGEAPFDFSNQQRNFQWGEQAGVDWIVAPHFKLFASATFGNNDIFRNNFTTLPFSMHNVYGNFGFAYTFQKSGQSFILKKKK